MRRAARTDANQRDIVACVRAYGATATITSAVGGGFPDIVVGYRGVNLLLEAKSKRGTLTDDQIEWHTRWRGQVTVVREPEDAVALLREIDEPT